MTPLPEPALGPDANGHDPAARDALTLAAADVAAMRAFVADAGAGLARAQESLQTAYSILAELQGEARKRLSGLCAILSRCATLRANGCPADGLGALETEIADALAGSVPRRPRPHGANLHAGPGAKQ